MWEEHVACSAVDADSLHAGKAVHIVAAVDMIAGIVGSKHVVAIAGVMKID